MAVAVVGVLVGGVTQAAVYQRDRLAAERTQGAVVDGYRRAVAAARAWSRPAELVVAADSIILRSVGVADTVVLLTALGPRQNGVTLTPALHRVWFAPSGLATGVANITHQLDRGSVRREVVISRLGRVSVP